MNITRAHLDGCTFLLDPGQDLAVAKSAILSAVRDGSDFVDFVTRDNGTVSLLVTPQSTLRFETIAMTEPDPNADDPRPDVLSLDYFDY